MSAEQQAKLLEEIAAVMRERPEDWWREFEFRCGGWNTAKSGTSVLRAVAGGSRVRRRPRTIRIEGEISQDAAEKLRQFADGSLLAVTNTKLRREIAALIGEVV